MNEVIESTSQAEIEAAIVEAKEISKFADPAATVSGDEEE